LYAIAGYNRRMKIEILNGLTAKQFLAQYWQKKPLLIRNALPDFRDFVSLDSLQALAQNPDVQSRLVTERESAWEVKSGPLKPNDFRGLKRAHWSLLVQGIDQLLPAARALLLQFDFIPHARLDDLMVSYAPKHGGVGPHLDSYDVFLLQGQGHKLWQISAQTDCALVPDAPLRILQRFQAEQEWILGPGDMLYLPPRYAHHGIALNDCLTYSIGFRAASNHELMTQFLVYLQDRVTAPGMYEDPDLKAQTHPAEIAASMIENVAAILAQMTWDSGDIAQFLGTYFTEPKPHVFFDVPARPLSRAKFQSAAIKRGVRLALKSQMLFAGSELFINGEHVHVSGASRSVLIRLADQRVLSGPVTLPEAAGDLLHGWYQAGYVELGSA
jgi:50S ribosomal protein L16 3-hydroxylase